MTEIIAEIAGNHLGDYARAVDLVDIARDIGCDAVKLQLYRPERAVGEGRGLWGGYPLSRVYRETATPVAWLNGLSGRGIEVFASVFDVDILDEIELPRWKVASVEAMDFDFVKKVYERGPTIISTGCMTRPGFLSAVKRFPDATFLHCVSAYPAKIEDVNLRTMDAMRYYAKSVGLSDHTMSLAVPVAARADMIEKHLTLRRADGGEQFALEPDEFSLMVRMVREAEIAVGVVKFHPRLTELNGRFGCTPS